jgi:4-amino-4-deoxy-L-arabinose transferase-like glycosyltransferase
MTEAAGTARGSATSFERVAAALSRQDIVWIAIAAGAITAVDLGRRILATNDEARFAMIAQDILTRGDWLFPRLNGAPYYNKPVLLAWLIALVSWPIGHVTQLTAVIPSALAAVGLVLAVFALGRDLFGRQAGRFAALVAMTSQGVFLHARVPMPDMLMAALIAASMWMLWATIRRPDSRAWLAFYALVGAAFWAKGPAGLLPLAVALIYAFRARRSGTRGSLHLVPGLALVAVIVGAWWGLGQFGDRGAVQHAIVVDQVMWYLPKAPTIAVIVAPLRELFGIAFPWVLLLPIVLVHAIRLVRARGTEREAVVFLVLWGAVTLLMVAASSQQRTRYYLPMVAPVALLIGWWTAAGVTTHGRAEKIPWRIYGITAVALVVATIGLPIAKGRWLPEDAHTSIPSSVVELSVLAAALGLTVAATLHGVLRDRLRHTFALAWAGAVIFLVAAYHGELERRNLAFDYPRMYAEIKPLIQDGRVVAAWGIPELPLSFYFADRLVAVDTDRELRQAVASDRRSLALLTEAALAQLAERDRAEVLMRRRVGFRPVVLVRYEATAPGTR